MNAGARAATGDVLLFLHADTQLPDDALALIEELLRDPKGCGGNFSLIFDGGRWESRALTWIYPFLRLGGMWYGGSGILVGSSGFEELTGYREVSYFCVFCRF